MYGIRKVIILIANKLIPASLLEKYRHNRYIKRQEEDKNKSTEETFTEIYKLNKWGGEKNEFCSGGGSIDVPTVSPYISMISEKAHTEGFLGLTFVDLGCGDFRVGSQLLSLCSKYIGIDIVKSLVDRNQEKYGNDNIRFIHMNIIEDELPDGEVCFVRQVLQHLSNQQIIKILPKLTKYKWVFITEHYPSDNKTIKPNTDKVHGMDIRINVNSGVYLLLSPFNLSKQQLSLVLEVPSGTIRDTRLDQGVIRTFLYKPKD